jgi:outer membrane protein insertion porin family
MSKWSLAAAAGLAAFLLASPAAARQSEAPPGQPGAAPQQPPAPAPDPPAPAPAAAPAAPGAQAPRLPPPDSPPLVRYIQLTFPTQGDVPVIDARTYLFYIQTQASRPSDGVWVPYTEKTEQSLREDFKRLWATNFLDDLSIEVLDAPYENGVMGKRLLFKMEEKPRVKIVDYTGSKNLDQSKIEEKLKEENLMIRLDSFIDPGQIRKVEGIVRSFMAAKGYQYAEVSHEIKPMPGGPKLVHLTFNVKEGPKVRIKKIDFEGNTALSDSELAGEMKHNRAAHWLSFVTNRGTYQEAAFEEDADRIMSHYRNKGYIAARIGQPEIKILNDEKDGSTRNIELKISVTEGDRYRVGSFEFEGNKVVKTEGLRPLFKLKEGDYYNEDRIRKGISTSRELYGSVGYWEFTGYPDLKPRNQPDPSKANDPEAVEAAKKQPAIVDVTLRLQEGEQYFVNRITFQGNTTTRDNVIRREIRLLENGVFNTEALKFSVKRINQLGYFKPIEEGSDVVKVEKTPGEKNKVDVTVKFEEQNRNQLTFGAGVSQYEGFFGQLAFQTSNFLGRGETATFSVLAGARVKNYQLAFSEPYLFDRPITAGIDLYNREIRYYYAYTQASTGGAIVTGFPVGNFSRLFFSYRLEESRVKDLDPAFQDAEIINRNPFLADALLLTEGGKRTISQVTPSFVHNTIDNPIFPNAGKRFTLSMDVAGVGGNVNFLKPRAEVVYWKPLMPRTTLGTRLSFEYIKPYGSTLVLPIYERLFLGGEYSIRGYDIRTVGPRDPVSFIVLGGNKSVLFNAELQYAIMNQVRVMAYFDAGQVKDLRVKMNWDDFVMSTGAEVRFFMPVLNVPFRLIYARNINYEGIYENDLEPAKQNVFKFAVGATF